MIVTENLWLISLAGLAITFVAEFVIVERRLHAFSTKEASAWVVFYLLIAAFFGVFIWVKFGTDYGQQFFAGWVTEYSLSVDNIFVFIVLMNSFAVPPELKHRVLLVGIIIALVLRAALIAAGVSAIHRFTFVFYFFSIFLFYTAFKVWKSDSEEPDPNGNAFVRFVERHLPSTRNYHGTKLVKKIDGRRVITPLMLVIIAVGTTDVLFALDSIPAVLGLTSETYLIVMVNAFALMGLRQLYFMLDGLMEKIIYLSKALAIILAFIGLKLFLEALSIVHHVHVVTIDIHHSFGFILVVLGMAIVISLLAVKRHPELAAHSDISERLAQQDEPPGEALESLPEED